MYGVQANPLGALGSGEVVGRYEKAQMTIAPSIIHVESPHVVRNLKGRLEKRRAELLGYLVNASDWADYKHRVGKVDGLLEALQILEDMEKRERN